MQYTFWQVVVIGGILSDKKLSSLLLFNSLSLFGQKPNDLTIKDNKLTELIIKSDTFNKKINKLVSKYGQNTEEFVTNNSSLQEDILISFESGDLLYALHDATMFVNAKKDNQNKWNFEIELNDTYDFTDFKNLEEYADAEANKLTDILSSTLNNFAVVSSEYGVIKKFGLKIQFITKEEEF